LIILAGMLLAGVGRAQQPLAPSSGDLTEVGLEALMNMEVSSPGRKEQKLSQTAGAVYVITQEDIRRSGVTSIPEALRMVPGLQVARINASMWAITSRGQRAIRGQDAGADRWQEHLQQPVFGRVLGSK
jgi:iron complex outermembrane receptor protein